MNPRVPTYRLYGERTAADAGFLLHCETIRERSQLHDWEIRPHRHEAFFQMLYISDGRGEMLADGRYLPFHAATAIFVPPGCVHGFRFSRDIGGLVVTVRRDWLDPLSAASGVIAAFAGGPSQIADAAAAAPLAVASLRRIAVEMAGRAAGRMILLEALVTAAVVDLTRASGNRGDEPGEPGDRDEARVEELSALIGAHFREHRPTAFYAGRIGVSAAQLNRIARAATGRSLHELIALRLIEEAKRNLVFTFLPAQSIGLELGFADAAYFSRFFKKHAGLTPAQYRTRERARLKF